MVLTLVMLFTKLSKAQIHVDCQLGSVALSGSRSSVHSSLGFSEFILGGWEFAKGSHKYIIDSCCLCSLADMGSNTFKCIKIQILLRDSNINTNTFKYKCI